MTIEMDLKANRMYVNPSIVVKATKRPKTFSNHSPIEMYEFLYSHGAGKIKAEFTTPSKKVKTVLVICFTKDDLKKIDYAKTVAENVYGADFDCLTEELKRLINGSDQEILVALT